MAVWTEFQPLKSVVLGRLFPTEELLSNINLSGIYANAFRNINDTAIEELDKIEHLLVSLGVEVKRPAIYHMRQPCGLATPPIAMRDTFMIYGDKVIEANEAFENHQMRIDGSRNLYSHLQIESIPHHNTWANVQLNEFNSDNLSRPYLHTANVLRCGKDLFISNSVRITGNRLGLNYLENLIQKLYPQTRIHWVDAEEHLDGYIFMIRPGLALSTIERNRLPDFFGNWDILTVTENDRNAAYKKTLAYKWKKLHPLVAHEYSTFLTNCTEETFFTINALSVDENTVIFPGYDSTLFRKLEKMKVTCIPVDMRATSFWDSGLHCCTNELQRLGDLEDYS